jgi:hypothetical protein
LPFALAFSSCSFVMFLYIHLHVVFKLPNDGYGRNCTTESRTSVVKRRDNGVSFSWGMRRRRKRGKSCWFKI